MKTTTRILIYLLSLGFVDALIPIPIVALLLIYVLYQKPVWFKDLLEEVYRY